MCGIAGSLQGESFWVQEALTRIGHRGPDHRDVTTRGDVTHGHCRLAILDLDARSNQPYRYGDTTLSYVGELWNYEELRESLRALGRTFRTEGDTEVVAAALDTWGPEALRDMDGQFAFAWTDRAGDTWVARDRMGEVPLYVLRQEGSLLSGPRIQWASERKAWDRPEAAEAVAVPPGSVWNLADGPRYYYRLPEKFARTDADPREVLSLLRAGVRKRLQADVPVTCLCSGGLDSSLILALVKEMVEDVTAYHITHVPGEDYEAAVQVCNALDVPLTVLKIDEPEAAELRRSIRTIEVVTKTQVEIGTLAIPLAKKIAEDGFKVVLSGEGADELFGGYGTLARKATADGRWVRERAEFLRKMGRSDLMRVNKALMSASVEPRTPFLDWDLIEYVLPCGRTACPPGKKLLKRAATLHGVLPENVIKRDKLTFQGGAGVAGALDSTLAGGQRKLYNEIAREVFGGIPRG
jgi:asparagine synthase (glutamine-hydrolysing)